MWNIKKKVVYDSLFVCYTQVTQALNEREVSRADLECHAGGPIARVCVALCAHLSVTVSLARQQTHSHRSPACHHYQKVRNGSKIL